MAKANPLGLKTGNAVIESQYQAMRVADNMPPSQVPRLLAIIHNLGFRAPVVTVGNSVPDQNSLQLADYLSRGADPKVPVSVQLHWPDVEGSVLSQASTIYGEFAAGIWEGFGAVAAALEPGKYATTYREQAIQQMPDLGQSFDKELALIAGRDLPPVEVV